MRVIARPLSFVALLALLAPSWAECRPVAGAAPHVGMSCCMKLEAQQGRLDSGCCTVRRAPESQQSPAAKVAARTSPEPVDAPAQALAVAAADIAPAFDPSPAETGSPGPPLYLRLSAIRR